MKRRATIAILGAAVLLGFLGASAIRAQQAPSVVNPLTTHVFVYESKMVDDVEVVTRKGLTLEEYTAWYLPLHTEWREKSQKGLIPGQPRTNPNDPVIHHHIAAWKIYYDQLDLWQKYLKQTIFEDEAMKATISEIQWGQVGGAQAGGAPGMGPGAGFSGPEALVAANQNKSMDSQVGEFFSPASGPGGGPSGTTARIATRKDIKNQVDEIYDVLKLQGADLSKRVNAIAQGFVNRLESRDTQRVAYFNELDAQKRQVIERAEEWGKRLAGEVVEVDGIRYELYSPAIGIANPEGASDTVRVVTDHLSPYDILNTDGSLKKPAGYVGTN